MRATIARHVLALRRESTALGRIELAPHQTAALSRIRSAFEEFGGAFLCDAVGVGKTFVAAALAAEAEAPCVVAPASLKQMWVESSERAAVRVHFISTESLSTTSPHERDFDLMIVDEAHHFRNPATKRYRRFCELAAGCHVLLMTATPIHNSERDMTNLARIFLGRRAAVLSESETARLIVRRERGDIAGSPRIPKVLVPRWCGVPDRPDVAEAIASLPAAVPLHEGGLATALVSRGLLRQWASSTAALRDALNRRLSAALALTASLEARRHPTASEIKTWLVDDDCLQLGFAEILSPVVIPQPGAFLQTLRAHVDRLRAVGRILDSAEIQDDVRASILQSIVERHPSSRIVAFASYESTIEMFFRRLAGCGGVASLTPDGGRVASGQISRTEILRQFAPGAVARRAEEVRLLLATDLLSEGVSLQAADVVVHLDVPWTAARLEQRVGRAARIGSRHENVTVYGLSPPRSAERILRTLDLVQRKHRTEATTIGHGAPLGFGITPEGTAIPATHEKLRLLLSGWRRNSGPRRVLIAASVHAERSGFLALIRSGGKHRLVCGDDRGITDDARSLLELADLAGGESRHPGRRVVRQVIDRITAWLDFRHAEAAAGLGTFLDSRRRVFDRLSAIIEKTTPDSRMRVAATIDRAREVAARVYGSAGEAKLEALARDEALADDAFLAELEKLRTAATARVGDGAERDEILALLLLTPRPSS